MASSKVSTGLDSINVDRLTDGMRAAGLDALVAASPADTNYLAGVAIRTQVSIPERLAIVLWPAAGEPAYLVCNIEETLARSRSFIADVRTYVEFEASPITALLDLLRERGLIRARIGVEERFLTKHYYAELEEGFEGEVVAADAILDQARAIKTTNEIEQITRCFQLTEEAIWAAWTGSHAGDTERKVAERMSQEIAARGATSTRHLTLAAGENTIHAHAAPGSRVLRDGDLVLTDFGGTWEGFSSDIARMGGVGSLPSVYLDEYRRFRDSYLATIRFIAPGVSAASLYDFCASQLRERNLPLTSPHVGHSLGRGGGHEEPILHPRNQCTLEAGMLLAIEPTVRVDDHRYHLEDLVLVTKTGAQIITNWESTERPVPIGG